ncbi:MAG: efflux RND transporter periplasmic adaptor subunit [Spirochaetaceae bacterium]|nr:efflux RND transporter periplasmic adaptor subunit [Spirochaetaceae bacterium]MBO7484776.1 efflux RND transporter periplasmic adaptor subunit [Spirochaetaceae bacterium]
MKNNDFDYTSHQDEADSRAESKKKSNAFDNIVKIIVVALIAVFLGLTLLNSFSKKNAGGGMPGGAPGGMPGGGAPGGMGKMPGGPGGNGAQALNTITVSAKEMKKETIRATVKINGDIASKMEVTAFPITSGKITQLKKNLGDSVKKGEVIAYVDPSKPGATYAASPITAPVSGTIITLNVSTGDTVNSGTAIATVGSLSDLEIVTYVSEKYSVYLKKGLPAFVSLVSAPDEFFPATVETLSPVVDNQTRTIRIGLRLDEDDSRIKPGMFASIKLVIKQEDDTFVIPKKALKTYNDKDCVFVIENNEAKRVFVTTGISNDSDIQLTSGVKEGDVVITAGSVTEGSPVKIAATTSGE